MKLCPVCSTEFGDDVRFCKNDGAALRSFTPAQDLVGQIVAERYHVLKKLGEGGMGQVYLAEHVKMGRKSAIKVMNPAMVHDPDAIARFNREAANASRITHPHVCAIYDFGETVDGLIYLAMEFVEGEPLTDLLEREGALPLERAGAIFLQTADALQAAHDLGIVHRDLKPDNIMITRGRGGQEAVKVVDFGIAKAVGGDEAQKVTRTGLVIGTPEFMSPEQLAGDPLDGRSDLYSLALVFFRMLTGQLPFQADTVQDMMLRRLTDAPLTLAEARPDRRFPAGLQACFDSALARSPAERYQSVAKFAGDVAEVLGLTQGAPALPRTRADAQAQTELMTPPAPPPPKKRSLVPLVLGAVVLLGGGSAAVLLRGSFGSAGSPSTPSGSDTVLPTTALAPGDTRPQGPPADAGRSSRGQSPRTQAAPSGIDLSRAQQSLDNLFLEVLGPGTAGMVRDSAMRFYNAPGIGPVTRGLAAFVVGQTWFQEGDRATGCEWIRAAARLDPTNATYGRLLPQCPG
ncbi:MAG TPA: serine/threonine-protein kinase [Gemmatimonadales bacterium]|nr:serine/threonine-protein kinase [Gemmatimonadales bacterium]